MGIKALTRLLGVLLICFVVFGIVKCASRGKGVTTVQSSETKRKVFPDFQINDAAKITLADKSETLTIVKGKESWEVKERGGYPADDKKVLNLIRSVWDLDIAQPVPIQRSQYGRVKLLDPGADDTKEDDAATILTISTADDKELGSIWLGKVHEASEGRPNPFSGGMMMNDVGRYVKRGDSAAVYIVTETFSDAEVKISDWLNDEFFEVSKIKSISRTTKTPDEDWSLSREEISGEFELANLKEGEELDPTKVTSMKSAFSSPQFEDVLVGEEAKAPDASVFKVETFDGFIYEIAAGEKNESNELSLTVKVSGNFAEKRTEGEEETDEEKKQKDEEFAKELKEKQEKLAELKKLEGNVYKVRSYVVDSITKTRSEILKEKKEEPADKEAAPEAANEAADKPAEN